MYARGGARELGKTFKTLGVGWAWEVRACASPGTGWAWAGPGRRAPPLACPAPDSRAWWGGLRLRRCARLGPDQGRGGAAAGLSCCSQAGGRLAALEPAQAFPPSGRPAGARRILMRAPLPCRPAGAALRGARHQDDLWRRERHRGAAGGAAGAGAPDAGGPADAAAGARRPLHRPCCAFLLPPPLPPSWCGCRSAGAG